MNTGEKEGKVDKQIPKKKVAFYKLFSFADSRDKVLMIIGTIAAIGSGLSLPIMAIIFGEIIDVFGAAQNADIVSLVSKVALKFVYLALGSGAASFLQLSCWMITGERQSARIRTLYLQTILQQDIAFYDQEVSTGEVIGRMSDDTILIHDAMGEKVGEFVHVISSFLGSFAIAFGKGWLLALVLSTSIPLVVMSSGIMSFLRFRMTLRTQKAYADAANVVQQTIGSIRTVASFTGENHAVANYNKFLTASYKTNINMQSSIGLGAGLVKLTMFCTYSLAVWFGAKMILQKDYTGGEVYTILYAVIMGSNSLGHASAPMTAFAAGQAAAFKMFETINRKPSIDAYDPKGNTLNDICGNIEFRNVCFSYPTRPKEKIFDEFSLLIPSGTTVALVGQSGSGKSTVISLIERFYDPLSGGVLIDGIDLREFQLKWIRSKIGLVSQEPVLFTTSIKDNIAYGKDGATLEEITAAAKLANAKNFIDKLPQGLDTMVGEHGAQLSGGQKQRIAIARAILKDPRILLFDEATSALDADSERIVQEALDNIMVNRTTVIVAHRLSTIRNADMIAVLHQGIIVEKGTHFELLKDSQGVYSNLIYSQEVHDDVEQNTYSREMESVTKCEDCSQNMSSMCSIISGLSEVENASSRPLSLSLSKTTIDSSNALSPKITIKLPDVSIFRLAHLNKPEAPVLVLGAIVSMITGAILPIFGLLTSFMISNFFKSPDKLKRDSEFWALMYIILGVVSLIAHPSKAYLFTVAGNMLIKRIRFMCFKKVVNMQMGWFDMPENSSGVICARLFTDASRIRALVGDALSVHIHEAASVLVALVISFIASWQLTLIILVILPMLGLNGYLQEKSTKGFSKDAKVKYEEASHIASDAVGNIRTVASFCAQERIIQMYKEKCEGPATDGTKEGLISGIGYGVASSLRFFFYAISFYAAARLVEDGKTSFSHVFRVLFALSMMSLALSSSSARTPDKSKAKSAVASVFAILDTKSMIDPSDESGVILENIKGDIELSHVNFSYPARPDVQILGDLSLTVHAGKIVALVGESGSGKSTVISLLQRFYDPDSGFITLDGVELRKFQVKWLRQQMGLVSQEPVLFNDTIRANIAYGKGGTATEAEIIAAAKSANAHEFISGLQQGYDTIVGERGVQLSGGQKQRVAIARAIVKGPKIVLLDEATSALDAESEKIVQEALDRVMVNRTTVVVAHRLSTIRGADEIAVFRNGRIVEKGNHNNLTNITNGFYSSLIALQTIAHS